MPTRASKRTTSWVGFKVHVTETCEKNGPHLITHVETTTAPVSDDARTATLHERLKHKDLLPDQHLVDTGYVDAQLLHRSQEDFGIDLLGPTLPDVKWQAQQQTGFDAGHFDIDWQAEQATCPEGHTYEYRSSYALARWGTSCSDEALGLGSVASSRSPSPNRW